MRRPGHRLLRWEECAEEEEEGCLPGASRELRTAAIELAVVAGAMTWGSGAKWPAWGRAGIGDLERDWRWPDHSARRVLVRRLEHKCHPLRESMGKS